MMVNTGELEAAIKIVKFILFRFQYSSQFISCSNVKRGGVGGNGISKLFFPSYFEHFKKDRVVVQTSNKGNNYNPTQHR